MFIFLEGLFQWRGEFGGDTVSLPAQAGDVSGVFLFQDETVHCNRTSSDGWASRQISGCTFSRTYTKNAGIDDQISSHDVRQNP
jgi:hypothetical protein